MNGTWLLIETSGRTGRVGLARGTDIVQNRTLDETRRMARDLAPAIGEMLQAEGLEPKMISSVMVSIGPGSYTGLRVGASYALGLGRAWGNRGGDLRWPTEDGRGRSPWLLEGGP